MDRLYTVDPSWNKNLLDRLKLLEAQGNAVSDSTPDTVPERPLPNPVLPPPGSDKDRKKKPLWGV